MILILDISSPFQHKPGYANSNFKNVKSFRCWWLWFAVTYCPLSQYEYEEHIGTGATEWVE